jgi:hypothetical protein
MLQNSFRLNYNSLPLYGCCYDYGRTDSVMKYAPKWGPLTSLRDTSLRCGWTRRPSDMNSSCIHIEWAVADNRQVVVPPAWGWARSFLTIRYQHASPLYVPKYLKQLATVLQLISHSTVDLAFFVLLLWRIAIRMWRQVSLYSVRMIYRSCV